jgi:uroporphyrinogen decarboxylase
LNAKTRVRQALMHMPTDRVPFDFWADQVVSKKLMRVLGLDNMEDLLDHFHIDVRYIEGSVYNGPELKIHDDGSCLDIWGVRRKKIFYNQGNPGKGYYEHVTDHPLASAETARDVERYQSWPSADWYDYSKVEQAADLHSEYAVICGGDRLNRTAQLKTAMYLRGVEQIMLDLASNGRLAEAIIEKTVDFYLEYNKRIFENAHGKIDIFFMGDDFGTQNGLMMSLPMWRRYFRPGFRKFIDLAHQYGIKVMHHSCGAIEPLIPDFIACGLDILQSLQPRAAGMDLAGIKQKYGSDICFQGGMDIQKTMPFGTAADVRNEAGRVLKALAPGGGYIFCTAHNIQAETPTENILALYEAAMEYGCDIG